MKAARAAQSGQWWLFLGICLLSALLVKPVQDRFEARRGEPEPDPDLLYFSSPRAVKAMALGYDGLVADFYWMRAIQYYGRREEASKRPVRYKNLAALFDITTTLDPNMLDAYRVGSYFIAEPDPVGAGQPEEALKLLDKGLQAHPQEWRLHYDKGFLYYSFYQDYRKAGEIWMEAAKLPSAPHWMEGLAAMSMSKGGSIEVAMALWQRQYEESDREDVRENARNHMISYRVATDLWTLEFLIEKFRSAAGTYPASLRELMRTRPRKYSIADPTGVPYAYDPQTGAVRLGPDSKIRFLKVPEIYKEQLRLLVAD